MAALLPADDSSAGFDNVSLGGLDPGRFERYLAAARKISRLAVGAPVGSPVADTFVVPSGPEPDRSRRRDAVRHARRRPLELQLPGRRRVRAAGRAGQELEHQPHRRPARAAGRRDSARRSTGRRADGGAAGAAAGRDAEPLPARRPARGRRPDGEGARRGGSAHRRRRVRQPGRRAGRAPPAAVPEGAHHRRRRPAHAAQRVLGHGDGAVRRHRPRRYPEPPPRLHVPAGGRCAGGRRAGVRGRDPLDPGPPRLPPARHRRRRRSAVGVLRRGPGGRRLRPGHRDGPAPPPRQPRVPAAGRARPRRRRRAVPCERSGTGVAAVVLPLEQRSRRRADRGGGPRRSSGPRGARGAGPAHAGRRAVGVAGHQLRGPVAVFAEFARRFLPTSSSFPISTRPCAAPFAARPSSSSRASCARTAAS